MAAIFVGIVHHPPPLADLPFGPLFLGREEAARYVGVSSDVFDDEVAAGMWPAPRRRGSKGGKLTWHRPSLDIAAEQVTGAYTDTPTDTSSMAAGVWRERSGGTTKEVRTQRRPQKAA
jgi:hypothetical protein